jgi:anti-sigma regulatory factor (Ser/Thr protein kinase)
MSMGKRSVDSRATPGFRHQAVIYEGDDAYLDKVAPILDQAAGGGQPILVSVPTEKARLLRRSMNGAFDRARFLPMEDAGRNPGRIISFWHDFIDDFAGAEILWGVGEPVWASRTPEELAECQLHERLLNHAFAAVDIDFRLFCPYDASTLDRVTLHEAESSHPVLEDQSGARASSHFDASIEVADLSVPAVDPSSFASTSDRSLADLREHLANQATRFGLERPRVSDFQLAVNEILTNSIQYAGQGEMAVWRDDRAVICEVHDSGYIADPLVGRRRPSPTAERGRGVWLAHQLCDLVQLRTSPKGTQVRMHAYHAS